MSNIQSKNIWSFLLMRWIARVISIPWAYWTLSIVWFVAGNGYEEGMSLGLYITIVFIAFLLTLGAAILAGVWGMEKFGGAVLLAVGTLILLWLMGSSYVRPTLVDFFNPVKLPFNFLLVLPPLLAGYLYLVSNRVFEMPGTNDKL
ncbi:MAG: hypothetical protein JXA82_17445 [Sedimentisphaerales bacterium]|nr:hypothetical protein [Sedimentisphaerales bacterium]